MGRAAKSVRASRSKRGVSRLIRVIVFGNWAKEQNSMCEFLETIVDKFIFRVAADCLYSREGIWVRKTDANGRVQLGVTDYLQQRSGDVAFIHVKSVGTTFMAGDEFAEMETIKANASLFLPIAGTLREVNKSLEIFPETINQDPYGKGWIVALEAADWEKDAANLLDPQQYLALIRAEAAEEIAA
jgi:glycine cleavage system H protein